VDVCGRTRDDTENFRNPSVSLSPTLARNEKVEHYIRIKTHKPIALRCWVESGVSVLCDWAQVSLVSKGVLVVGDA